MSTSLIWGILLIIIGIITKFHPLLIISGYKSMTEEEKAKVDVEKLSAFLCIYICSVGALLIALHFLRYNDHLIVLLVFILTGFVMNRLIRRYNHN